MPDINWIVTLFQSIGPTGVLIVFLFLAGRWFANSVWPFIRDELLKRQLEMMDVVAQTIQSVSERQNAIAENNHAILAQITDIQKALAVLLDRSKRDDHG